MPSYTLKDKERAFTAYVNSGGNLKLTQKELKSDGLNANMSTLLKWKNTLDPNGKNWDQRFEEIQKKAIVINDNRIVEQQVRTVQRLFDLEDFCIDSLKQAKLGNAAEMTNTYLRVITKRDEVLGIDTNSQKIKEAIGNLIGAIKLHPVLGPLFEKHWHEVEDIMQTQDRIKEVKKAKR